METQYKFADFDSLHIEYDRFILTRHGREYVYETPRNEAGRIAAVKGRGIDIILDGAGVATGKAQALQKFDDVQVTSDEIVLVKDGVEHRFSTPRNEAGRVTAVVCGERSRPLTYEAYTVTFNGGGGEGTLPAPLTQYTGQWVTMPEQGELVNGLAFFNGWKDEEMGAVYCAGDVMVAARDVELTAQWLTLACGEVFADNN